jgi:3-hydroxyisobutyrate dehydrogenase-like beta-hydroxyacid dehydrogenase
MTNNEKTPVTVIGMGAMGRAMATTWAAAGHQVTVWNRTPGRAGDLDEAATIEEAVEASQLVVVCVLNYEATYAVLPAASLAGRTVVQLTTGTPGQAREMATWATEHGASYVDGGVMATPPLVGRPGSLVFYSGTENAFQASQPALTELGEARFVGEDPGRAALYDLALLSAMYGMFGGIDHALALGASEHIPETDLRPMINDWLRAMLGAVPADLDPEVAYASLRMQAANYGTLLDASREQGVRTNLVSPMGELLHRAVAAGPGHSLPDLLRAE